REVKAAFDLVVEDQRGGEDGAARPELRRLPEAGEDRIVAGAQPVARGVGYPVPRADRAQDVEILAAVEARDLLEGGGGGSEELDPGPRGQPVGLPEPPGEAQALPAQRMLRPAVEAPPLVGVHERALHAFSRPHAPDLPPLFSRRQSPLSTIPRSTALTMSYTVRPATAAAVSASISTPVLSTVRTRASMVTVERLSSRANVTSQPVMRRG